MRKIIILGDTGLLGHYMLNVFDSEPLEGYEVLGINREVIDVTDTKQCQKLKEIINIDDVVINCIGVLKHNIKRVGLSNTLLINSWFPQYVSDICYNKFATFIHICSDCVFTGQEGNYTELDTPDARDYYAKTKSIHPTSGMIIRTSFIGEDNRPNAGGLIAWMKSQQPGSTINGYTNCIWNGVTALHLSRYIRNVIESKSIWVGLQHIYSSQSVTKAKLCHIINDIYDLKLNVIDIEASEISGSYIPRGQTLDRTLKSIYKYNEMPDIVTQLKEMKLYNTNDSK